MPWLQRVHERFAEGGFAVIGVAVDSRGWPAVKPFLTQYGIGYPNLLATPEAARAYRPVEPLPLTVFLDRQGRIVARHHGMLGEEHLEQVVELLLAEPVPGHPATSGPREETPLTEAGGSSGTSSREGKE